VRTIISVIDQMLAQIPADQTPLRADLERVKSSASYRAPEMTRVDWWDAAQ
jgi:hypothetical protein